MASVFEEFLERRELLNKIDSRQDKERLVSFLEWMESCSEIKNILEAIRKSVDIKTLIPTTTGYRSGPKVRTPEEVRAFGLYLLEQSRALDTGLYTLCHNYNIHPRYGTKGAQGYVNEALEQYINPLLDFVQKRLKENPAIYRPDNLANSFSFRIFTTEFDEQFPLTHEEISKISNFCSSPNADNNWYAVGLMCREALNLFVKELKFEPNVSDGFKAGDTKGILKKAISQKSTSAKASDTLAALLAATWDHTQSLLHRRETTKSESLRLFLWVCLTVSEIGLLFTERTNNRQAPPACPVANGSDDQTKLS